MVDMLDRFFNWIGGRLYSFEFHWLCFELSFIIFTIYFWLMLTRRILFHYFHASTFLPRCHNLTKSTLNEENPPNISTKQKQHNLLPTSTIANCKLHSNPVLYCQNIRKTSWLITCSILFLVFLTNLLYISYSPFMQLFPRVPAKLSLTFIFISLPFVTHSLLYDSRRKPVTF